MELTPGPNMTWLALVAAQQGRTRAFRAVFGVTLGMSVLAVASAFGAAALIEAYPPVYDFLRWAGVLFLAFLAVEAWIGERDDGGPKAPDRLFWRGFLVNVLNPKAMAVFAIVIPSAAAGSDGGATQIAAMAIVYVLIATTVHVVIVAFAGSLERFLSAPGRTTMARRVFAVGLGLVAVWFALAAQPAANA